MKKILSLILAALICFAAVSCGTTESSSKKRTSKTSSSSSRRTAEPTPEQTTESEPSADPTMPPPKNDAGDYYLVGVNPPYEQIYSDSYLKIEGETFQMAGNTCSNGIVLNGNNSYVLINLEGKYSTLDFDIGHVDDSGMEMSTITFFIDGQEVQSIDVDPEALPQHVTLPLNNGYILKIQKSCEWSPKIGLSEMVAK